MTPTQRPDREGRDPWNHDPNWVWKNLFRGNHFIVMDGYIDFRIGSPSQPDPKWDATRQAMGAARALAQRMGLAGLTPNPKLASSGFCLASSAGKFRCAAYLPQGGEATVDLTAVKGSVAVEWIEAESGERRAAAAAQGGGRRRFAPPVAGPAILWLASGPDTARAS